MFRKVVKKIKKAEKIAIFTHVNPDGDALGSAFGLKLCLLAMGKTAEVFIRKGDETLKEYKMVKGTETQSLEISDCDLKIAVDCADKARLGMFADCFDGETVAVDHHVTHKEFAKTTLVVPTAPATGEIIVNLAKKLGIKIDKDIAYNLYLAIVCDTGNFKFSSTTPQTHLIAAKLMETGIDFADISKKIFDTKSMEYLEMYKQAIERLELYHNGKIALLWFTEADFESVGISEADANGIVVLPNSVFGAEVGVYIRQRGDEFKVSLRSNGKVNVANIASEFGGGGHERASGFSMKKSVDEIKKAVTEKIAAVLDGE